MLTTHRKSAQLGFMVFWSLLVAAAAQGDDRSPASEPIDFAREIQPILAKHCLACHGPDKAEAGLRLDRREDAVAELESGDHAIVPGQVAVSGLIARISSDDESERMPPEGDRVSPADLARLKAWVESGAKYSQHWAYRPIREPTVPRNTQSNWPRNPIDQFVLAQLRKHQVQPAQAADRATLVRRLHYDLVGLPPTPDQVSAFVHDQRDDAYVRLVDELLASPHFGERWGRHWLDKARYADSDGYEKDRPRPNAWRYRDWVIDAINRDLPFDQFTVDQLAGDLLTDATPDQKLATAFHRQTLTNTEGGTDKEEFRVEATFDRTETTAAVWLGLTMTCARCHSHKYDQITQTEYYQMYAFFNDANESNLNIVTSQSLARQYEEKKRQHDQRAAELQKRYDQALMGIAPKIESWAQQFEDRLRNATPLKITSPKVSAVVVASGGNAATLEDGSILLSGKVPDKDLYTIDFLLDGGELGGGELSGVRLDLLTDKSLPKNGPGRAGNGNFVLTHLEASLSESADFAETTPLKFAAAEADFAQQKFGPANALNSDVRTGWAISPQMGKSHEISFYLAEPMKFNGPTHLRIKLVQSYGGNHTLGRFRIRTMSGFDPLRSLPNSVAAALRKPKAKRTPGERQTIADHVASLDAELAKLRAELDSVKKNAPKPPTMSVRVISPARRTTKILRRGDFLQPLDPVQAGSLQVLDAAHPFATRNSGTGDRLDLAMWLVNQQNPLTHRVTVNHVWAISLERGWYQPSMTLEFVAMLPHTPSCSTGSPGISPAPCSTAASD